MAQPAYKVISHDEYLAREAQAEYKSEYFAGRILAMAGASVDHNRIVGNVYARMLPELEKQHCTPFMLDLRLFIEEKDVFTYPDAMIICGKPEFYAERNDTVTNPVVIFEVLSESTRNYDRGEKFEFYRAIPSLREYVLIDQDRVHVERFLKTEAGDWLLSEWNDPDATLKLASLDFGLRIADVYRGVELPPPDQVPVTRA